jgi:hypothetical protein
MHWSKTLQRHYVKSLPYATLTTTIISTYSTFKNEMSRPFRIPIMHSVKNVAFAGTLGALTGLCYPLTFPVISTLYLYNIYKSEIP